LITGVVLNLDKHYSEYAFIDIDDQRRIQSKQYEIWTNIVVNTYLAPMAIDVDCTTDGMPHGQTCESDDNNE
jgi:hypothetical protein